MKKRPSDNPFVDFPEGFDDRGRLTMLQRFALPVLLWFFDTNVGRGTGRTYLAAVLCLELAKRGGRVLVSSDPSLELTGPSSFRASEHFMQVLHDAMREYPEDIFSYDTSHRQLIYRGRRI